MSRNKIMHYYKELITYAAGMIKAVGIATKATGNYFHGATINDNPTFENPGESVVNGA